MWDWNQRCFCFVLQKSSIKLFYMTHTFALWFLYIFGCSGPWCGISVSISPYSGPTLGAFPLANLHFHGARLLYRLYCKTWLFNPTWTGVILGQVIDGRGALIHQNIGCKLKKKKLKIWHFPNEIGHFESVQCEFGGKLSRFPWF